MTEAPPSYPVVVIGAGDCFNINLKNALSVLGPVEQRIVVDIDQKRLQVVRDGIPVQADASRLPFSFRRETIGIIATPNHLPAIKELVACGVRNLIIEKPMVNNSAELSELDQIIEANPDLKVYPLDYYQQKAIPLGVLTGKIIPGDPRYELVADSQIRIDQIGQISEIFIQLIEGGELGVPNLGRRPWLMDDPLTGGMLLDLGTHAFTPLFSLGLINPDELELISARRSVLSADRKSLVPRQDNQPEIFAEAELRAGEIPVHLKVGKIPEEARFSSILITGENGHVLVGLKRDDHTTVRRGYHRDLLKLRAGTDLYGEALKEAARFFRDEISIEDNMRAMRESILLIDRIKAIT